jgi:hypothetical protein
MVERQMVLLTSATGSFHARVIVARLQAEGIRAEIRGAGSWPWPTPGDVKIYVGDEDFEVASEVLLFDRVDAVFQPGS